MRPAINSPVLFLSKLWICIFVLGVGLSSAQSLGELARRQRARKQSGSAQPARVYTNEDLARPQILGPSGRNRSVEEAPAAVAPSAGADRTSVAQPWPTEMPLGDVARFYRQWKEAARFPKAEDGIRQARESKAPALPTPAPRNETSALAAAKASEPPAPKNPSRPALRDDGAVTVAKASEPPAPKKEEAFRTGNPVSREPLSFGRQVRVRRGDSLWKLASRHLDNGNEWRKIAALNPEIADPNLLRVGQQVRLPGGEPSAAAAKQVRVKAGDSLWRLARAEWGEGGAWSCIVAVNPQIKDAERIYPGQLLTLPSHCAGVA